MVSIQEITQDDFDQFIQANELVLIDCYADWCGPCKMQGEKLETEGNLIIDAFPQLQIVKLDSDKAPEIGEKFDIDAIPQLMVGYKGKISLCKVGVKEIPQIIEFINHVIEAIDNNAEPENDFTFINDNLSKLITLKSDSFEQFIASNDFALVLFWDSNWPPSLILNSVMKQNGNAVTENLQGLKLATVNVDEEPVLKERSGLSVFPQLVYYKSGKPNYLEPGFRELDEVVDFGMEILESNESIDERPTKPLSIVMLTNDNFEQTISDNELVLILPWKGESQEAVRQLVFLQADANEFITTYPDMIFAALEAEKADEIMKKLGISIIPTNVVFYKGLYGVMLSGEKSTETILKFMDKFIAKCNTEEVETAEKGMGPFFVEQDPIIHLDAKEFDTFVAENELILLDCWASWCGPCRNQGAILQEGADELKQAYPNLVIAKLNTDEDGGLTEKRYNIHAIPQLIVFYKGCAGLMSAGTTPISKIQEFIHHFLEVYESSEVKTGVCLDDRNKQDNETCCDDEDEEDDESENEE